MSLIIDNFMGSSSEIIFILAPLNRKIEVIKFYVPWLIVTSVNVKRSLR